MTPGGGTKPGGGGGKAWKPGGGGRRAGGCTGPMLGVADVLADGWTGPIEGWTAPMTGPCGAGAAAIDDETNAGGRAAAGAGGASPFDSATRRAYASSPVSAVRWLMASRRSYASSPVSSRRGGAGFDMATRRA